MSTTMIIDTLWVLLASILVFFMNLGFAAVEAGFARAKNTVNILSKNFIVFAVSSLGFLLLGWGLMFGGDNPVLGTEHLFVLGDQDLSFYDGTLTQNVPFWGKFFFQLVFCGTAATIVSRGGGGEDQIRCVYSLLVLPDAAHLPYRRTLGMGRRLACGFGIYGFCRRYGGSFPGRLGRPVRRNSAGAAHWEIRKRREGEGHTGP